MTDFDLTAEERTTFIAEAEDELDQAETVLLEMEAARGQFGRRDDDPEKMALLFCCRHTIKGNAGSIGLDGLTSLAHGVEDLMQRIRDGQCVPTDRVSDLLLRTIDALREHLLAFSAETDMPELPDALLRALQEAASGSTEDVPTTGRAAGGTLMERAQEYFDSDGSPIWCLRGRIASDCDSPVVRCAQVLMQCEQASMAWVSQPSLESLEASETSFEGDFEAYLQGLESPDTLKDSLKSITGVESVHFIPWEEVQQIPANESAGPENGGSDNGHLRADASRQIRVDVDVMDRLMNQVVEMVINRNRLSSLIQTLNSKGLTELSEEMLATVEQMAGITTSLQEDIMKTRLVPLDQLFRRFPRMMRNLHKNSGKPFRFDVVGAETEIDRSLLDAIGDPLIHILRNAVDHGLEDPDTRKARGKPPMGTITLEASRQESYIVVEISDDGGGIDPARVLEKARSRGLIQGEESERLTDEEVADLLFSAGFSTSEEVTEISGRGVGLDVVRRDVEAVNGTVSLENRPGEGTTFRLALPLTVTTVRSLLVEISGQVYVIPLSSIRETLHRNSAELHTAGEHAMIPFRGQFIPLFRLADFFSDLGRRSDQSTPREDYIVILSMDRRNYGLMVDAVLGEEESVIKPLRAPLNGIPGISSATIRPDGRVALILDANGLFKEMRRTARRVSNE